MICPFCARNLGRQDVEMWGSFTCLHCHKLVRIRRNYPARVIRLALTIPVLLYVLTEGARLIGQTLHRHISFGVGIGLVEEYVMLLLPATLEPAAAGGFTAS